MIQTILELSAGEARNYFLQASRFCTIDLPKYFDFQNILTKLELQIGEQKIEDIRNKECDRPNDCENINYKFLTNKDGNFAWRPLQIINPAIYVCLVNRITAAENWELIQKRFADFRCNEKIRCYSLPLQTDASYDQLKIDTSTNILNWWEEIEQQSIELALRYNSVLITDITDCYGSIYTHSIGWALHGKEAARDHRKVQPPTLIGCVIDSIIQTMSYRQTNGIPQGSVLMDFIAEMVLGYADLELSKKIKTLNSSDDDEIDYQILRYRDDYRIFANTQENAVKIAKLLSEVLADLNLKLNIQKTFVSNSIIRDVIKPDKLYWNEQKHEETTLQKHLLLIHNLAEKHPNSGSLSVALNRFIDRIYPLSILKEDSSMVLVSILVDIAYNNPRTYSSVIVCLGKILSLEPNKAKVDEIYSLINKKFENKPNIGYWKVWVQRLTIKEHRKDELDSGEKLCQIAADNPDAHLWNISWLKEEYQQIIQENGIFNESVYEAITEIPEKSEASVFLY